MNELFDFKKQSEYAAPEESPGYLLWRVSTHWRSTLENVLRPLGLTHPQFVILAVLAWQTRTGARVSQAMIARTAGLDPNTTSQILRGLERKKLIERTHLSDERSKNPMLTPSGNTLLAQALPAVEAADKAFFAPLSFHDMQVLLMLFQKILG